MALNQDEASIGWIKGNAGKPSSEEQRTANGERRTANSEQAKYRCSLFADIGERWGLQFGLG